MKAREILYERTIYKSYMKISAVSEGCFDERLILMKALEGTIPCEKSYIDGRGQYWYDITGKQALDNFCKINAVEGSFIEYLLLSVCNVLESLEWNLIDDKCLKLDPELIFINHTGEEVAFVLYPETESESTHTRIRILAEYLLTKMKHTENASVSWIYELYEYMITEDYSMVDLKNKILQKRVQDLDITETRVEQLEYLEENVPMENDIVGDLYHEEIFQTELKAFWDKAYKKTKDFLVCKKERKIKEEQPVVIYPEEELLEPVTIHPTICMTADRGCAKGVLVYEGIEGYSDCEIGTLKCEIGKNNRVKLQIKKDTISQFHAKIEYQDGKYYIEDMNSTNGTYVNEELLNYKERRILQSGDIIQFADVRYRFW